MPGKSKQEIADLINYAKSILNLESFAIQALNEQISESFAHAAELILHTSKQGHVIVSGMGKAGFVGMKLSATFASTGVPSFFLHPAEAVHGDLGRYRKTDLALLLSNSGETEELNRTIPQIRQIGCPLISITASATSTLGRHSDLVLTLGNIEEACPLGLAPTASTAAMLALGDALAMTILKMQNFTREQFAFFHPAGKLGRKLLKISEVMRTEDRNLIVPETMIAREVIRAMTATPGRPGAAAVVDNKGKLNGIFTDGDLRRLLGQSDDFLNQPIANSMSKNPRTISDSALAADAMAILSEFKIDQVIVVNDNNQPVGLVDIQDLFETRSALNE